MQKKILSYIALASLVINAICIFLITKLRPGKTKPIPNCPLRFTVPERDELIRFHPQDFSRPVAHVKVPQHPYMAPNPGSNMHCDAYISDTYEASGPLGINSEVISRTEGFGGYGTVAFDSRRRLVGVYGNGMKLRLELIDPDTLEKLVSYDLPPRSWTFFFRGIRPWEYLGAGMYFYLDHLDRAVVPTTRNTLQVVQAPDMVKLKKFELVREYDLAKYMVPGKDDSPAFVLPDWDGKYYWFASVQGVVGTINVDTGLVNMMRLQGELVENSFAVGEDGVFIISDQAMYRFSHDGNGKPVTDWRSGYSKAAERKAGLISVGSGTSVTITGTPKEGLIVIADNAEPRINLLFIKRSDGTIVGSVPLFEEGKSATDLTAIAFAHADESGKGNGVYSAIVENNWGPHTFPFSRPVEPGLTRVDAVKNKDGTYTCKEIWSTNEKSVGGFRLSMGNGLVYIYDRVLSGCKSKWYLTAIDFKTGETVYKKLIGTGIGYNNWQGSMWLHPNGGTAISTTIFGVVMVRDIVT
jgi:hypothetical protein